MDCEITVSTVMGIVYLDHLSVKPGSKRLKSYGQTAIFDHFVRKRHFLSRRFTDKALIFIGMSVNGGAFAKCSACSISASRREITDSGSFLDAVMHGNRLLIIRFLHIQTPGRFAINRRAIRVLQFAA